MEIVRCLMQKRKRLRRQTTIKHELCCTERNSRGVGVQCSSTRNQIRTKQNGN
jgi:hypothetical protein